MITLQELIGELYALSMTYPAETVITVRLSDNKAPLDMVIVESDNNIEIVLKG